MAKKKTETASETPKKATASKKAAKPAASTGNQLVDTNLAAHNAAKLLVAGLKKPTPAQGTAPSSKMFQQLKAGQSNSSIIGGVLDKNSAGPGKSNAPFHAKSQKGHNQTFGADVSKSSVPRRTSGG